MLTDQKSSYLELARAKFLTCPATTAIFTLEKVIEELKELIRIGEFNGESRLGGYSVGTHLAHRIAALQAELNALKEGKI